MAGECFQGMLLTKIHGWNYGDGTLLLCWCHLQNGRHLKNGFIACILK